MSEQKNKIVVVLNSVGLVLANFGKIIALLRWVLSLKNRIETDTANTLSKEQAIVLRYKLEEIFERLENGDTIILPPALAKIFPQAWLDTVRANTTIDNSFGAFGETLLACRFNKIQRQLLLSDVQVVCDILSEPEYAGLNSLNKATLTATMIQIRDTLKYSLEDTDTPTSAL